MMKSKKRGNQQGVSRGQKSKSVSSRRRSQIHQAQSAASSSVSSRRATTEGSGKLDKGSTMAALKSMGLKVDADGSVNLAEARQVAEGTAASAAQALGVNIVKADGSIDTRKARQAIGTLLGFSIDKGGSKKANNEAAKAQADAAEHAQEAAVSFAKSLGVNIRNSKGKIDTKKATQVANLALDLKVAKAQQHGRREAVNALNTNLDAMTTTRPESRRAASEAMEKLMSSSVLVDGKIDRRKALEALQAGMEAARNEVNNGIP